MADESRSLLELVSARMAETGTVGVALGVQAGSEPKAFYPFGWRDREARQAVTPDTLFGIASLTKSFIAIAILQLAEQGRLDVDDPVVRYVPRFHTTDRDHTRAITLHHLLTHSSGLPPLALLDRAMADSWEAADGCPGPAIRTPDELLDALAAEDMRYVGAPGEQLSYSNEGYALLGFVVEAAAEQSLADYLSEHITDPLGLTRTMLRLPGPDDEPRVRPYRAAPAPGSAPIPMQKWRHAPAMLGAGFIRSTAEDLLRYLDVFREVDASARPRILTPASLRQMTHPHQPLGPHQFYGYGVHITEGYHGLRLVEHSGGLKGVASHFVVAPEVDVRAVALANLMEAPCGRLALAALNDHLGWPLDEPRVVFTEPGPDAPRPQLAPLVGVYTSGEGDRLEVTVAGERLAIGDGQATEPVEWVGALGFRTRALSGDAAYYRFLTANDGSVLGMTSGSRVLFRV